MWSRATNPHATVMQKMEIARKPLRSGLFGGHGGGCTNSNMAWPQRKLYRRHAFAVAAASGGRIGNPNKAANTTEATRQAAPDTAELATASGNRYTQTAVRRKIKNRSSRAPARIEAIGYEIEPTKFPGGFRGAADVRCLVGQVYSTGCAVTETPRVLSPAAAGPAAGAMGAAGRVAVDPSPGSGKAGEQGGARLLHAREVGARSERDRAGTGDPADSEKARTASSGAALHPLARGNVRPGQGTAAPRSAGTAGVRFAVCREGAGHAGD